MQNTSYCIFFFILYVFCCTIKSDGGAFDITVH